MLGYESDSDFIKNRMDLIKKWEPRNEVYVL